jgi:hypothetical protein
MKNLIAILFLVSTACCFGQDAKNKSKQVTISEIRKSYPYNKTDTIKLVSFKYEYSVLKESNTTELEIRADEIETPRTDGQIDMTKMFEVKTLGEQEEENLMKILTNSDHQETNEVMMCYEPRNGIAFLDKDQRIIGYIEICFECLRFKTEPGNVTINTLSPTEFKMLKTLFKRAGIVYGTNEGQN